MKLGLTKDAKASFMKAIELKSDYSEAYNNIATLLSIMNRHRASITNFLKSLVINPNYAEGYNNLGDTQHELLQYEDSIINHNRATLIKPSYEQAYASLAKPLLITSLLNLAGS